MSTKQNTGLESPAHRQAGKPALPDRLTPAELRARMGWSVRTLRRRTPLIGHIKDGRRVLFPLAAVERYERERTVQA